MQSLIKPGNSQLLPLKQYQSSLMDNDSPTGPQGKPGYHKPTRFIPTPQAPGESWVLGRRWTRFRMLCLAGIVCSLPKIRKSRVSSQTRSISNHNTPSYGGFHKWGNPKSSISVGFSIINHPAIKGYLHGYGNPHIASWEDSATAVAWGRFDSSQSCVVFRCTTFCLSNSIKFFSEKKPVGQVFVAPIRKVALPSYKIFWFGF